MEFSCRSCNAMPTPRILAADLWRLVAEALIGAPGG
jgi:hypothetical protein